MTTDAGGWRWQKEVIEKNLPLNKVTSTFRSGSVAAGGGLDYHSQGYAVDIGGPNLMGVFEWLLKNYPTSQEIIYSPANNRQIKNGQPHYYSEPTRSGHFTHVHWAYVSKTAVAPGAGGAAVIPAGDNPLSALNPLQPLIDLFNFLTDPKMWLRIAMGALGVGLLVIGLVAFTGKNALTLIKGAATKGAASVRP